MADCIFCGAPLHSGTKREHIVLDAMGGRKTSRLLICDDCNVRFGATIDDALAAQVRELRNKLGAVSGSGKPPPMVHMATQVGIVRQASLERPTHEAKPFSVSWQGDRVTLELNANSPWQVVQSLRHAAAQLGTGEGDLLAICRREKPEGLAQVYQPLKAESRRASFGGEMALRSVVKSCLELVALEVGNPAVRSPDFDASRRFVTDGGRTFSVERVALDSRPLPMEADLRARFGEAFHLVSVSSDADGRLYGYFRLYGFIAWRILLAERSPLPGISRALVVDPVTRHWSESTASEFGLTPAWLEGAAFDQAAMGRRLAEVHRVADRLAREEEIGRIIDEEFSVASLVGDAGIDDESVLQKALWIISDRIARTYVGVPYSQMLSWDVVEQWLADPTLREGG